MSDGATAGGCLRKNLCQVLDPRAARQCSAEGRGEGKRGSWGRGESLSQWSERMGEEGPGEPWEGWEEGGRGLKGTGGERGGGGWSVLEGD